MTFQIPAVYRGTSIATMALCSLLAAAIAPWAAAQEPLHARISYEDGGALIRGGSDADWSFASINTLVLPGDALWADKGGTIELEMAGGAFLRMADGSRAEIVAVPPSGMVKAITGSFYVQRTRRSTGSIALETPAARIDVDPDTHVRVDVVGDGATTVSVRWGRASVRAEGGAPVVVTEGKRTYIDPGFLPSTPQWFDKNYEDGFDSWARERARFLAVGPETTPKYVTPSGGAPVGYYDLEPYGEWVYVDRTPYWRPTVVVDYVPYRSGYWSYVPAYGYTWVGSYPFCYITSHYGRWTYHNSYGWMWCYRETWAPAWAYTARYGDCFVWAPLDLYDRPYYYGDAYITIGGIRIGLSGSSYCYADNLYYGPSYINPCRPGVFSNINADNVYIWNIYAPNSNININTRLGRNLGTALVRDYSPQRYIRGLESSGLRSAGAATTFSARARAVQLEETVTRTAFQADRSTMRSTGLRTPMREASRSARVRDVAVSEDTQRDTRLLATRDIGSWATETARTRNIRTGKPAEEQPTVRDAAPNARPDRVTTPVRDGKEEPSRYRAERERTSAPGSGPTSVDVPRTTRSRPETATTPNVTREPVVPRTRESRDSAVTTPRTTKPPTDMSVRVPSREVRGATPDNGGPRDFKLPQTSRSPQAVETPSRDRVSTPTPRTTAPAYQDRSYESRSYERRETPSREYTAPRVETPSRTTAPEIPQVRAPRTESPQRYTAPAEPRYQAPAPQRYEAPSTPRYQAPEIRRPDPPSQPRQIDVPQQRSFEPQRSAPSRDVSAPRFQGGGDGGGGSRGRSK